MHQGFGHSIMTRGGRLGPLTFALALFTLTSPRTTKDNDLAV
jgi:hypothetical protein